MHDSIGCDSDTPPLPADIHDLPDVLEAVVDVIPWKRLGLTLGLHYPTLQKIEKEHYNDTYRCKIDMLAAWLQQQDSVLQKGVPSWSVLQAALKKIRENELAHRILGYIGMCAPPPPHPVPSLPDL